MSVSVVAVVDVTPMRMRKVFGEVGEHLPDGQKRWGSAVDPAGLFRGEDRTRTRLKVRCGNVRASCHAVTLFRNNAHFDRELQYCCSCTAREGNENWDKLSGGTARLSGSSTLAAELKIWDLDDDEGARE